jgi:serine protease Do
MNVPNRSRVRLFGVLTVLVAAAGVPLAGQPGDRVPVLPPAATMLAGPGATIGVGIRDVDPAEAERQKLSAGVLIEDVRANSPADKAGLRKSDVVTEFDGERVRSARQFSRLVQETPAGRTVKLTVVRDGRASGLSIAPEPGRAADVLIDHDRLAERLGDLGDRLPFNFDFDLEAAGPRGRLGATVENLTPQLATYFGVRDGVLVSAVSENSPAARAGLTAGDVIITIDGRSVSSRNTLVRLLRDMTANQEITIGIVREKKESSVKATLDRPARRQTRPARIALSR